MACSKLACIAIQTLGILFSIFMVMNIVPAFDYSCCHGDLFTAKFLSVIEVHMVWLYQTMQSIYTNQTRLYHCHIIIAETFWKSESVLNREVSRGCIVVQLVKSVLHEYKVFNFSESTLRGSTLKQRNKKQPRKHLLAWGQVELAETETGTEWPC